MNPQQSQFVAREICSPPFRLDLVDERLWQGATVLPLKPKAFAVLHFLLQHVGQLVTKEQLFQEIWGDTRVGDAALRVTVQQIRDALGDKANESRFIETVHGRGYRFIAKVVSSQQTKGMNLATQDSALRTHHSVLVGRDSELIQLQQWWERARSGERQLVFVTGEPGIGKTSLVDTFIDHIVTDARIWVARGQCVEQYGAGEAYLPVLEALQQLCRGPRGDYLINLLRQHAPLWLAQMPTLLSVEERSRLQQEILGATQDRMLREMATLLEILTAEFPLVLWLEDLHWGDVSTLALLAVLARRRETAKLLVIATYRPVEVLVNGHLLHAMQQELQDHGLCHELALSWLSETAVHEYLTWRFPTWRSSTTALTEIAQRLHERTAGNPLALVTLVDDLVKQEALVQVDGQWTLRADLRAITSGVPISVRHFMERQIDRLSPDVQVLLAAASIVGFDFSAAAVAAALDIDVHMVEERCAELIRQQLFLYDAGLSAWPDGTVAAQYRFRHALFQEVWAERVTPSQRQCFHKRVGDRLETAYGAQVEQIAAELAMHFEYGRDYRKAILYREKAAAQAMQRLAGREAVEHLTTALQLLQQSPDSLERVSQELTLQFTLYTQLGKLTGEASPATETAVTRVRELSQVLGDSSQVFWALAGIFPFYIVREELQAARLLAERCLQIAQRFPTASFSLAAHTQLGIVYFFLGEFTAAQAYFEQALGFYNAPSPPSLTFDWEHGPPCLCYAAFVLWHLGYPDQALHWSQKARALAQELRLPYMQLLVGNLSARFHHLRRERDAVHEQAVATLQRVRVCGFAGPEKVAEIFLGWAWEGTEDRTAMIRANLDTCRVSGGAAFQTYYLALLAETCAEAKQIEEGQAAINEALAIVQRTNGRYYEAELYRLKGELLLAQADKLRD